MMVQTGKRKQKLKRTAALSDCQHKHGDHVPALMGWVCGQCWTVLHDRPKRYGMKIRSEDPQGVQEIIWQAEIRKSDDGTTLSTFLRSVARRVSHRSGMAKEDAYQVALEAARMLEVEFGHPDYDWSRTGAIDIADEEMSYWDEEPAGSNA